MVVRLSLVIALLAPSYADLRVLAETLWAWCWRFRVRPYPGRPKTFVFALGPGAAADARPFDKKFSFVFSPANAATRLARLRGEPDPGGPPPAALGPPPPPAGFGGGVGGAGGVGGDGGAYWQMHL